MASVSEYPFPKDRDVLAIPASQISYGVYFQFSPNGPICCASHRYWPRPYFFMCCFINNRFHKLRYKSHDTAHARLLILREDISGSAPQLDRRHIKNLTKQAA